MIWLKLFVFAFQLLIEHRIDNTCLHDHNSAAPTQNPKTLDSSREELGLNFKHAITEIHYSMDDSIGLKNISSDTIAQQAAIR